jgi:hypothetical protein
VLDSLFEAPELNNNGNELFAHLDISLVDSVLRSLLTLRPYENDVTLGPAWLDLVSHGFVCLATLLEQDDEDSMIEASSKQQYGNSTFPELLSAFWTTSFKTMLGKDTKKLVIDKAASMFSTLLTDCVLDSMVQRSIASLRRPSSNNDASEDPIREIVEMIRASVTNVHFRDSWCSVLIVAEAAFVRLAADAPMLTDGLLTALIEIRDEPSFSDNFPFKEEMESALEAAAQAMGFERFTMIAPLNIFDVTEEDKRRPYLLTTFNKALERPSLNDGLDLGPANLAYFTETMHPLYNRLRERSDQLGKQGSMHASKLFETLAHQAFTLFPAICATIPRDLPECFDQLAPRLGKILQTDPTEFDVDTDTGLPTKEDVRPFIYSGLESLVMGYAEIVATLDPEVVEHQETLEIATLGLARLRAGSNKFLSVLCNIFTSVSPNLLASASYKAGVLQGLHERGNMALERCITAFLNVAEGKSVVGYFFNLVKGLLQAQTEGTKEAEDGDEEEDEETAAKKELLRLRTYAILDLLCVLLPFLPEVRALEDWDPEQNEDAPEIPSDSPLHLFYKVLTGQLRDEDGTLQKKTYKALNLVVSALIPSNQVPLADLMNRLVDPDVLQCTTSGAKKARMKLLQLAVEAVPDEDETGQDEEAAAESKKLLLEFVPMALSEVMLTTKEASEKARTAAFECLIAMGRRMLAGGIRAKREKEWENTRKKLSKGSSSADSDEEEEGDAMDADGEREPEISLKEYLMMVVAGLAGSTSNMQSASIACLSRILFEFNGKFNGLYCQLLHDKI